MNLPVLLNKADETMMKLTLKRWRPCWYENRKSATNDWNQRHLDRVNNLRAIERRPEGNDRTSLPVPHHQLAPQAGEVDAVFQDPLQKVH